MQIESEKRVDVHELTVKKEFWQFPISLKLVATWIGLLGLFYLLGFVYELVTGFSINLYMLSATIIYFNLTTGLINKQDSSRIWLSIFVGVGTLVRFVLLMMVVFFKEMGGYIQYNSVRYPVSRTQEMVFLILNILLNAVILYILLRPSTSELFSPQSVQISEANL